VLLQEEEEDHLYELLSVVIAARQHSKKVPCCSDKRRERGKDEWPKNLTLKGQLRRTKSVLERQLGL